MRKGAAKAAPTTPNDERPSSRHEEEAQVDERWEGIGYARIGRKAQVNTLRADIPRLREELAHERVPVDDDDSGEVDSEPLVDRQACTRPAPCEAASLVPNIVVNRPAPCACAGSGRGPPTRWSALHPRPAR